MPARKPQKSTIKEQVYEIIREMILSQQYKLGEKINIDALASSLNVSNSPIREALTMLHKQGLVENIPNVGFCIISFSPTAYMEISKSLYTIIVGAYDLCIHQNTLPIALQNMKISLEAQKSLPDATNMYEATKAALSFDKQIILATHNSYLLSIYEQMEDVFFLMAFRSHQRSAEEHAQNIYEHSMILNCMEQDQVAEAKNWLFRHYDKHI